MSSLSDMAGFKGHREHEKTLRELLTDSLSHIERLDMHGWLATMQQLGDRLASNKFKVLVLGEFKRGKSTFINALLGEHVLPSFAWPCTAVINEVKWGEEKRAILHFRDPLPDPLPMDLPALARHHLQLHAGGPIPSMEIPIENLEEFVVIQDPAKDHRASVAETPYDKVELYWPLGLCQDGVEIIDSPGLNEHGIRTKVTMEYLNQVDAVIFVFSCGALASASEMNVIEWDLREAGHQELFLVCNRFDQVQVPEQEGLKKYASTKLSPLTDFGTEGVFFLSALDALEGKLAQSPAQVDRSGINHLEQKLMAFLIHDRGRIKLLQLARDLRRGLVNAADETIPNQRGMLNQSLEEFERRVTEVKPQLEEAEQKKRDILQCVERHRVRLRDTVRREVQIHQRELAAEIPNWMENFQAEHEFELSDVMAPWKINQKLSALKAEIQNMLEQRVKEENHRWQTESLESLINAGIQELSTEIEQPVGEFFTGLDQIREELSGVKSSEIESIGNVSNAERIFATSLGGLLVLNPAEGAVGGYQGMLRGLMPSLAVIVGLAAFHVAFPLILAAITSMSLLRSKGSLMKTSKMIKNEIAKQIATAVKDAAAERADQIAELTYQETVKVADAVTGELEREIGNIHDQVEAVLDAKREGEEIALAKSTELDQIEKSIKQLEEQLTELIFNLAGSHKS